MFDLTKLRLRLNEITGQMKLLGLMAVIWSALVAGSLAWYTRHEQQSILSAATTAATAYIKKDISFRNWAASHGGVYVPPSEHTPPNPHLQVPERDVVTTTGKTLTLMNPAYMLRQMQSDFPDDYGTRSHLTSLKPLNPNNAADAWETKALHAFEQGSKELLEAQQIDGQPYLRMMLPFIVEPGCLKCHAHQGYKLGDIRGGISTSVPLAPFSALEGGIKNDLMLSHGAIWLLGLAGLVWLSILFRRIERMKMLAHSTAAVEKSERRFRAVRESANDAVISADSTGKVVEWNPSAERLFGYTEAEIIGQPLTVLMPERYRDLHRAGLARVAAGGAPHVIGKTVELVGLRKDGSEFPLEISLAQWQAAGGQFFTAIIRDITERKLAQETLREEESLLLESQRIAHMGSWRFDLSGQLSWSDETYRIYGVSPDTFTPSVESFLNLIHPDDRLAMQAWMGACVADKKPDALEFRITLPDGTVRILNGYGELQHDAGNRPSHLIGIVHDITERKQAEQALQGSESKYRRLIENSPDIAYTFSVKRGGIYYSSQVITILGYSVEHLYDYPLLWNESIHPEDRAVVAKAVEKFKIGTPYKIEYRIKNARGDWRWFYDRSIGGREENGDFIIEGLAMDITERKQAETQLAEQLDELRRWHKATSGREARILELKHEINELLVQAGQPPRYPSAESDEQPADE